jgi:hypothetical protein
MLSVIDYVIGYVIHYLNGSIKNYTVRKAWGETSINIRGLIKINKSIHEFKSVSRKLETTSFSG